MPIKNLEIKIFNYVLEKVWDWIHAPFCCWQIYKKEKLTNLWFFFYHAISNRRKIKFHSTGQNTIISVSNQRSVLQRRKIVVGEYREDREWCWRIRMSPLAICFYKKAILSFLCHSSLPILQTRFLNLLTPKLTTDQSGKWNKRSFHSRYFSLAHFSLCCDIPKTQLKKILSEFHCIHVHMY